MSGSSIREKEPRSDDSDEDGPILYREEEDGNPDNEGK